MEVNDTGVRLRETPGLDGKIIRTLIKGEYLTKITHREFTNDSYRWINVKTATDTGWVYGEYVSLSEKPTPYKFNSINDARIPVGDNFIEIGMTKDSLIELLGSPRRVSVDTDRAEEWLDFYYKGRITVMVTQVNNRVNQCILYTPEQALINKTHVGMNINELLRNNDEIESRNTYIYSLFLANYFKSTVYECSIMLDTNAEGIIKRIQIGGSS
jgi:hypothetical protein